MSVVMWLRREAYAWNTGRWCQGCRDAQRMNWMFRHHQGISIDDAAPGTQRMKTPGELINDLRAYGTRSLVTCICVRRGA